MHEGVTLFSISPAGAALDLGIENAKKDVMTSRYRVEYALKGLLAVPFVLHSQPNAALTHVRTGDTASNARRRYAEIMRDVEQLVNDHIEHQRLGIPERSKLKLLVPSLSIFFTPLFLEEAFMAQDAKRAISSRRFVSPSFNDIRLILNTAQIMSLVKGGPLQLVTFDGDVTLYDDGASLIPSNQVISRILALMSRGIRVGVVTAAGYEEAKRYNDRLHGLLEAINSSEAITPEQKKNFIVLGGEANFMFQFNSNAPHLLESIPKEIWALDEMRAWKDEDITELLDIAEVALNDSVEAMRLNADIIRKSRAVGVVPKPGTKFFREQLEETVLAAQKVVELSDVGRRLPFCAFNGGNDVFVDIGDKRLGVACCQRLFGDIQGINTLHVGDQFLSVSGNDFKTRMVCTTCWVASPAETVDILDEFLELAATA
ncbi:IMP 5'-nucleotidase [Orbilia oligospora]|nr:IMP 5'-nucleotidase [Orbilia oligospora]KAF3233041.1 IMP 5'-nucleotidase [Orbilia oligospora]